MIKNHVLQFLSESLDALSKLFFVVVLVWSAVRMGSSVEGLSDLPEEIRGSSCHWERCLVRDERPWRALAPCWRDLQESHGAQL